MWMRGYTILPIPDLTRIPHMFRTIKEDRREEENEETGNEKRNFLGTSEHKPLQTRTNAHEHTTQRKEMKERTNAPRRP